eukprot:Pgem_evm1s12359
MDQLLNKPFLFRLVLRYITEDKDVFLLLVSSSKIKTIVSNYLSSICISHHFTTFDIGRLLIHNFPKIIELSFHKCTFSYYIQLQALSQLKKLTIQNCHFCSSPFFWTELTSLESLTILGDLYSCDLDRVFYLTNLKELSL